MTEGGHAQGVRSAEPSRVGRHRASAFLVLVLLVVAPAVPARDDADETDRTLWGDTDDRDRTGPVPPAEDPNDPRRHFRAGNAADLGADEAERIYAALGAEMADRYRLSRLDAATAYRSWARHNTAPYRSAAHGQRFLNNYGNDPAAPYGRFEDAGILPVGSILAKDSFTVTEDGTIAPGPLFLMEKMPAGFNYVSGDWRYTMILPDGSVHGTTRGAGADQVDFCIACHLAVENQDHLFFIPEDYRRR